MFSRAQDLHSGFQSIGSRKSNSVYEKRRNCNKLLDIKIPLGCVKQRRKFDDQFPRLSGNSFGKRLREIRTSKNISIKTLAEKIGVMETYIPQLERGMKTPSFDTLIYIANALNVTADELLCDYINAEKDVVATALQKKLERLTKQQQQHIEEIISMEIDYMTRC